jgi:hypothetical protein
MSESTNTLVSAGYMVVLGLGLGATMQVLVLAVQNSVEMKDMGVATTSSTFFRSMGSTFGAAIMGAILTNQLTSHLAAASAGKPGMEQVRDHGMEILQSQQAMERLPAPIQHTLVHSFTQSLSTVFLVSAVISIVAFGASWFIKEQKLRGASPAEVKAREADVDDEKGVEAPALAH